MKVNELLREQILQVVENQLRTNDPPETKQAYKRLTESGISDEDARIYIGQCVAVEIYDVLKNQQPFNQERFVSNLKKLPEEPFE
jgi:hypothetical protein